MRSKCHFVKCFLKLKLHHDRLKANVVYKIIHKILDTIKLLYLATIKDSPLRSIWNMHAKCLENLFYYCHCVKIMGRDGQWNKLMTGKNVNLDLCLIRYI